MDSTGITGVVARESSLTNLQLRPHYVSSTNLVYSDGGRVASSTDGSTAGVFESSGLMVPDSTLDRAFFLREVSADTYSLDIYDLQRLTHLNSISIPGVLGYPTQMVRWGSQGLAFLTDAGSGVGMLYILQGTDISGLPAPPAGCITLNPATVFVGVPSPATITVTGSNFLTSSTVLVNDSPRTTSYISPTQLSFQLTSADLASAPGTHTLSETNDNVETCS